MFKRLLLTGIAAVALLAAFNAPAPEAKAQGLYIGPGGLGFSVGAVPRDSGFYYGPRGSYWSDGYWYEPGYTYRYGRPYRYRYRGVDDFDTADWIGLGLNLISGRPRYYYGDDYYYRTSYTQPNSYTNGRQVYYSTPGNYVTGYSSSCYDYTYPASAPAVVAPSQEQLDQLAWSELQLVVANGVEMLDQDLRRFNTGDQWRTYLQIDQARDALQEDREGPPAEPTSEQLSPILQRFERIASDSEFQVIADLPGFQVAHAALDDYLEAPSQRQQRVLANSAAVLDDALENLSTAEDWRGYLSIDQLTDAANSSADANMQDLDATLSRFDEVAGDPDFRAVAQLDGFQATRLALEDFATISSSDAEFESADENAASVPSVAETVDPLESPPGTTVR